MPIASSRIKNVQHGFGPSPVPSWGQFNDRTVIVFRTETRGGIQVTGGIENRRALRIGASGTASDEVVENRFLGDRACGQEQRRSEDCQQCE
jgi:hypothetical protein